MDTLREELRDCRERKRRADILLKSLASEKQKWMVCLRMLSGKFKSVAGDVILGAAYLTFLPGFTKKFRNRLVHQWIELMLTTSFSLSKSTHFSIVELFGDPQRIRLWTSAEQLPNDDFSLSNAIVMDKTERHVLSLDP